MSRQFEIALIGTFRILDPSLTLLRSCIYQDFYISGNCVPDWDLSYFMRGYARNWYAKERKRPPLAFTMIAASDKVLLVRGSKTGGMAIFRRIQEDMQPVSYGDSRPERADPALAGK